MQRWMCCLPSFLAACMAQTSAQSLAEPDPRPAMAAATAEPSDEGPWLESHVQAHADQLVLIHQLHLDATPAAVWAAHTTGDGWEAWAAPVAEVDLRVGGTIRTHYDPSASIGDPGTNTLHVLNYAEERVLTLQAVPNPSWPPSFQADASRMYNVILMLPAETGGTRLLSFGLGYRDTPEHREVLGAFEQANAQLYGKLRAWLERGQRATFDGP